MKTPEQELLDYWLMPKEQLSRHVSAVSRIAELRAELCAVAPTKTQPDVSLPEKAPPQETAAEAGVPKTLPSALARRLPMRAPQEGSLRYAIHEVLSSQGKPMRRNQIIEAVAKKRGVTVTDLLCGKIGDALLNRHDPYIQKVAYGTYTAGKGD